MSEPLTTIIWQRFSHSSTTTGSTPCGICGKRGWAHTDVAPTRSQGCGCYDDWRKTTTASGLPQPDSTIFRSIRQSSTSPSILPSLSRKARKLLGYLVCKRWDTLAKTGASPGGGGAETTSAHTSPDRPRQGRSTIGGRPGALGA